MTTWFVTRHPGARHWVEARGIAPDRVVEHLDPARLGRGDRVLGTLPVHLAAEVCRRGAEYHHLTLDLPPELRGRELDAATMEAAGARLERFEVHAVPTTKAYEGPGRPVARKEYPQPRGGQRTGRRVLGSIMGFIGRHRLPSLFGLAILIGIILSGYLDLFDLAEITGPWTAWGDPLVGMATLAVASLVWFGEVYQDWRAQLPCRLTVRFYVRAGDETREVMRCERAHLSSEADMRQLGQQIGSQMADGDRNLGFNAPAIESRGGGIEYGEDEGLYRHYQIEFTLNALPKSLKGLPEGQMILWVPPFRAGEERKGPATG